MAVIYESDNIIIEEFTDTVNLCDLRTDYIVSLEKDELSKVVEALRKIEREEEDRDERV